VCPQAQIQYESAFVDRKIRCVLIHDHLLLRQGLRRLLEDEPDMEVVAEAEDAATGLLAVAEHRPEIVIMDAGVFDCAADQAERMVLGASQDSQVLFLSLRETIDPADNADKFADGTRSVMQHTSAEELAEMVRQMHQSRETHYAPKAIPRRNGLTTRESEVLKLLAEGRTVRSAAGVLGLSMKTVDAHKFNLMRKLGVHNKAELVMWAIQKRVVKLPVSY
jgi:two-component system, NarL family, response regulator NreC